MFIWVCKESPKRLKNNNYKIERDIECLVFIETWGALKQIANANDRD